MSIWHTNKFSCLLPPFVVDLVNGDIASFPVHHLAFPNDHCHAILENGIEVYGGIERLFFESLVKISLENTECGIGYRPFRHSFSVTTTLDLHNRIVMSQNVHCPDVPSAIEKKQCANVTLGRSPANEISHRMLPQLWLF